MRDPTMAPSTPSTPDANNDGAALYQRNLAAAQSGDPPRSLTGLRDVPSFTVVHNQGAGQMLLQPDHVIVWDGAEDPVMTYDGRELALLALSEGARR